MIGRFWRIHAVFDRSVYRAKARPESLVRSSYSTAADASEAREFLRHFGLDRIPREQCELSFSRSSGPGGQNVNKLNTKATLRVSHDRLSWVPSVILNQLRSSNSQYLTKQGDLVIQSQRSRTQEQNREDCFRKLADVIFDAGNASIEGETSAETRHKVSKMIKRDNERRIEGKKLHSAKKSARRSKGAFD